MRALRTRRANASSRNGSGPASEGLTLVDREGGNVDEADRVGRTGARDGDDGAPIGVADQQHRPVDLVDVARITPSISGSSAACGSPPNPAATSGWMERLADIVVGGAEALAASEPTAAMLLAGRCLNRVSRDVTRGERKVDLSAKEF